MLNKNTVWKLKLAPKELALLQGIPLRMPFVEDAHVIEGKVLAGREKPNKVVSGEVTAPDHSPLKQDRSPGLRAVDK